MVMERLDAAGKHPENQDPTKQLAIQDEAIKREIYKRIYDEFSVWTGTLDELMKKYGMTARDMVYKDDIAKLILDVAEGKRTREEAKEHIKGFVATAYAGYKSRQNKHG